MKNKWKIINKIMRKIRKKKLKIRKNKNKKMKKIKKPKQGICMINKIKEEEIEEEIMKK